MTQEELNDYLIIALKHNDFEKAQEWINAGVNVNAVGNRESLLSNAIRKEELDVVKFLINNKANVCARHIEEATKFSSDEIIKIIVEIYSANIIGFIDFASNDFLEEPLYEYITRRYKPSLDIVKYLVSKAESEYIKSFISNKNVLRAILEENSNTSVFDYFMKLKYGKAE